MEKMEINRRLFLAGLAAAFLGKPSFANTKDRLFAACRKDEAGKYFASIFGLEAGDILSIDLPDRGHDIAVHPLQSQCVFFARRPGRFAVVIDYERKSAPIWFYSAPNRHFFGHGVFSNDGRLLYTTENDYEQGGGVIGVRDVQAGYQQTGEFPSYGIGPHDMALLADGKTLVIANGGIETHPESGREKLNLADMKPSLVYMDCQSGELLEQHFLSQDLHQLSIRHLALSSDGQVVFGGQYEGAASDLPPLIGFHKRGENIQLAEAPESIQMVLKNYIGSVSVDESGRYLAASSPKGGLVTYWDVSKRSYMGESRLADCCGLAPVGHENMFLITNGAGTKAIGNASGFQKLYESKGQSWDNHAVFLKV